MTRKLMYTECDLQWEDYDVLGVCGDRDVANVQDWCLACKLEHIGQVLHDEQKAFSWPHTYVRDGNVYVRFTGYSSVSMRKRYRHGKSEARAVRSWKRFASKAEVESSVKLFLAKLPEYVPADKTVVVSFVPVRWYEERRWALKVELV